MSNEQHNLTEIFWLTQDNVLKNNDKINSNKGQTVNEILNLNTNTNLETIIPTIILPVKHQIIKVII